MKLKLLCSIIIMFVLIFSFASCKSYDEDTPHSSICIHQWDEWKIVKDVSCTVNGTNTRFCNKCEKVQSITIYAKGHSYGEWTTTKETTCLENGIRERICSNCPSREIETMAAPGFHSFGDWSVIQKSTCFVNGTEETVCACGEKKTAIILASHNYVNGICSECGAGIIDITIPTIPIDVSWISNDGTINNTLKITSVRWEVTKDNANETKNIKVYYSGEKIYNGKGVAQTSTCQWIYKLYDTEGYVIASGSLEINYLAVGDKFKDNVFIIENLNPSESYTLVLCDAN